MTTVTKTDLIDHDGDIDGGTSYNVPQDNGRCFTKHVPSGPSSLAKINLVERLGVCDAFQAPPSGQNFTFPIRECVIRLGIGEGANVIFKQVSHT